MTFDPEPFALRGSVTEVNTCLRQHVAKTARNAHAGAAPGMVCARKEHALRDRIVERPADAGARTNEYHEESAGS
jgi:hypothetical protein